jgi:hypothetical protein
MLIGFAAYCNISTAYHLWPPIGKWIAQKLQQRVQIETREKMFPDNMGNTGVVNGDC